RSCHRGNSRARRTVLPAEALPHLRSPRRLPRSGFRRASAQVGAGLAPPFCRGAALLRSTVVILFAFHRWCGLSVIGGKIEARLEKQWRATRRRAQSIVPLPGEGGGFTSSEGQQLWHRRRGRRQSPRRRDSCRRGGFPPARIHREEAVHPA